MATQTRIPKWVDVSVRIVLGAAVVGFLFYKSADIRLSVVQRDSVSYWATGQRLIHHQNPYDTDAVTRLERQEGYSGKPLLLRIPPWSLFMVLPLGLLSSYWACLLWLSLSLAALLASMRFCAEILPVPTESRSVFQVLGYTFAPVLACLYAGQMGLLMLLGFVIFLRFHSGRPWLAGAALLLPFAKPHVSWFFWIALLLWMLARRKYVVATGFGGAVVAATLLALAVDPTVFRDYASMLTSESIGREFIPALSGVIRLLFFRNLFWVQFVPVLLASIWFIRFWIVNRLRWNWTDQGLTTLVVSVVVTPYGWMSDEVILIPAVLQAAGFLYLHDVKLDLKDHAIVGLLACLNGLLLLMLISKVPFQLGVYFWSSLVWFAWYAYGRRRTRERL